MSSVPSLQNTPSFPRIRSTVTDARAKAVVHIASLFLGSLVPDTPLVVPAVLVTLYAGSVVRSRGRLYVLQFASRSPRNGNEPGGVDAPIPVTESVDASRCESVSMLDSQSKFVGPCFRSAVPVACLWLSLWVWAWSLLVSVSVASGSVSFQWGPTREEERAPTPKPAVITRSH